MVGGSKDGTCDVIAGEKVGSTGSGIGAVVVLGTVVGLVVGIDDKWLGRSGRR